MKRGKKGAALILTLFTLVIVSSFISLLFLSSKNEINIFNASRQESRYVQYLREALDVIISPILMGDGRLCAINNQNRFRTNNTNAFMDEFITVFKQELNRQQNPPYNPQIFGNYNQGYAPGTVIFQDDNSGINIRILRDPQDNNSATSFSVIIYRREFPNSNRWVVSHSHVRSIYLRRDNNNNQYMLPSNKYSVDINTFIFQSPTNAIININNFSNFMRDNINNIIWQGRAKATIVPRSPYGATQNSALFVKFSGLWVPFGANPFSQNLVSQGIDSCIGITQGYDILGDVVTPRAEANESYIAAFDNSNNSAKSGITTIWTGTPSSPLIRGNSTTGYAIIHPNNLTQFDSTSSEYSIRTNVFARATNGQAESNIEGRLPGEGIGRVVDFDSLPQTTRRGVRPDGEIEYTKLTIRVDSPSAVVVGADINGQTRTRNEGGGLIEVVWPMRDGQLLPPDQTNKAVLDVYPPGYANVYIVPEGNELRIFAVGKYSGRKVPANELRGAIHTPVNIPFQIENGDLVVNLNNLTREQIFALSTIHVEGGNVVLMPDQNGNSSFLFDTTIVATRLYNTDSLNNRRFYETQNNGDNQNIDPRIGGWLLPDNNFVPNNFTVNLGQGGIRYFVPQGDAETSDRRRQVVRALEGNVIIQDFHDRIGQGRLHARDQNQENLGYVGFSRINDPNAVDTFQRSPARITILSHNFVILNYQVGSEDMQRRNRRNQVMRSRLAADIVTYRGNLQIIDADMYRFLLDTGRFNNEEVNEFMQRIITNDSLYWYGKYLGNFASVEGVLLSDSNRIRGFRETVMQASDYNYHLPRTVRRDYMVNINGRPVVLFEVEKFEVNK